MRGLQRQSESQRGVTDLANVSAKMNLSDKPFQPVAKKCLVFKIIPPIKNNNTNIIVSYGACKIRKT